MSDTVAAQREARKRKITQNAQSRMNRLLGKQDAPDNDQVISSASETEPSPSPQSVTTEEQQPSHTQSVTTEEQQPSHTQGSPYNLRRRLHQSESLSSAPPVSSLPPSGVTAPPQESLVRPAANTIVPGPVAAPTVGFRPQNEPQAPTSENTEELTSANARSIEVLRFVACMVTSFFSRAALFLGLGPVMFESIFVPFIAMETIFIYTMETYCKHVQFGTSRGTMIAAALMLCGIKSDLMDSYHRIMSHVSLAASDFALYLFSFVIWDAIMT